MIFLQGVEVSVHTGSLSALKKRWEADQPLSAVQHTPSASTPPRSASSAEGNFTSRVTEMEKTPQRNAEDTEKPNVPLSSLKMMFESKVSA